MIVLRVNPGIVDWPEKHFGCPSLNVDEAMVLCAAYFSHPKSIEHRTITDRRTADSEKAAIGETQLW
ncbi:hypothetical protein E2C01_041737 [Portunus trituberculatus]|uniref:Uncharacterized protein n=1 Tax=Portunus trituberculatus TaxID=210409 RepID=A0A5B7FR61_PORTR|nr:hypothetical protein [Portunus trituberculatus]